MAEFIWKDTIKITTRELTRGELVTFWGRILKGGDLNALVAGGTTLISEEKLLEVIAAEATAAVAVQNGKGWKTITESAEVDGVVLPWPMESEAFLALPMSLANGWLIAAQQETGDMNTLLNFTARPDPPPANGTNSSATASGAEPSTDS